MLPNEKLRQDGPASAMPGRLYLRFRRFLATGVLLLNDHVLKQLVPEWVTGLFSEHQPLA